jgi:predicted nucleic acid-binding protein
VVINDLNLNGVTILPNEADSPLIVDSNAVFSSTVALQLLEPIRWRNPKRIQIASRSKNFELSRS